MKLTILFRLICIFYVSAFFMSCQDPNEVGSSLLKEDANTAFIDTFSIETQVVFYPEDLLSNKANSLLVGKMIDPNFGEITDKSFVQLRLSEENVPIEDNVVCDSVIFFLPYKINDYSYSKDGFTSSVYGHAQFVGDTNKGQTIAVHELTEGLITDQNYTVHDNLSYNSTALGSVTTAPTPTTGYVYNPKTTPTLKIPLEKELGTRLLNLARNNTQDNFLANFKGLALVSEDNASILNFDHITASSRMAFYVYYHTSKDEAYYFRFYVNNESLNFNQIKSNRSSTSLNSLQNSGDKIETKNLNHFGYLQSGTGICTQVTIPHLQKFLDANPLISINGADLIFYTEEETSIYAYENGPVSTVAAKNVVNALIEKDSEGNAVFLQQNCWWFLLKTCGGVIVFISSNKPKRTW